jgi:glyoxylase-like metal-dependent hydrolase (beta-lactamase superfamily II)
LAVVVFGAACTSESSGTSLGSSSTAARGVTSTTDESSTSKPSSAGGSQWARVNMGFVSAYILYRDGEATLVDTGQSGAESDIEAALTSVNLGWNDVSNVVLTHRHPDHVGSLGGVAEAASGAALFIGAGDAAAVGSPPGRALQTVGDGDEVFDLSIIDSPGHTPGHISVLDGVAGILVAGDAVNTNGGTLNSSDPNFTADQVAADATVAKLAGFEYEIVLPGHGEPILEGGSTQMADLAARI